MVNRTTSQTKHCVHAIESFDRSIPTRLVQYVHEVMWQCFETVADSWMSQATVTSKCDTNTVLL